MPQYNNHLRRFTVELAVHGIDENKDPSAEYDFDFELSMRSHILEKTVSWNRVERQITIQVVTEGVDPQTTANGVAEELFEVAAGLLNEIEGMHIKILKVEEYKP